MALFRINTSVLCLMALLLVSTTLLLCEASGRNIGLEDATCGAGYHEPYSPPPCADAKLCDHFCKQDGKGDGTCRNGACCCSRSL
ncbi:hypothetical protein ZWY2020_041006 [Hordeum vulgare]|uniref:Predicted protein n=1 Tax=Hordeum vulgare subsp. vulgare TaxID=112509 RepID=F2ELJ1_HORVV|nr:hypothetical protein ZWY2020_041006 [Hordeum vulgare]BAK08213.1 predicted protein [Hordeum vulgare subsp. vulgare]